MGRIQTIEERGKNMMSLFQVWEASVKETHTFLSGADIVSLKPEVEQGIIAVQYLYGFFDDNNLLQGFIGVDDRKIEMLFIDDGARGQGIGKQLINFALTNLDVQYVDVNEQNEQAVGFYRHMGFATLSRSAYDDGGRPFPILHLVYEGGDQIKR